jgi:hypothetical protein
MVGLAKFWRNVCVATILYVAFGLYYGGGVQFMFQAIGWNNLLGSVFFPFLFVPIGMKMLAWIWSILRFRPWNPLAQHTGVFVSIPVLPYFWGVVFGLAASIAQRF